MEERGKLLNVRDVLEKHSYTTSLEELKSKGREKVRVVKADQIAALIEEAVVRILGESKSREEVESLVGRSRDEFKRLLEEREKELSAQKTRTVEYERLRAEHAVFQSECERLRREVEETRRERSAEAAAPNAALGELLGRLQSEMSAVRETLTTGPARPSAATAGEEVQGRIDALARTLGDRLDRIARKVGLGASIDESPVNLGAIFGSQPELESNLENLDVKEQRSGGIAGAVEKARSLRRKGGSK